MGLIHFDGIVKEGKKTVINDASGIGLDVPELIKAQLAPKEHIIKESQDIIDTNTKKLAAYSELKTILTELRDVSDQLRYDTITNPLKTNVFDSKEISLISSDSSVPSSYIEAAATDQTPVGSYQISVTNIATAKNALSDSFTTQDTSVTGVGSGYFGVGTFTINNSSITIASGDSLIDIVSKINLVQQDTNTQAYIVQVSSSDYRLALQSMQTGIINSYTITDPAGVLSNITFNVNNAQDAYITFNNIVISNPENIISNIVTGLVLNIRQATPSTTTLTLNIENSPSTVSKALKDFQDKYNNFIGFFSKQTAKKAGFQNADRSPQYEESAVLAREGILYKLNNNIRNVLINPVLNLNQSPYNNLSSVGIKVLGSNSIDLQDEKDFKLNHEMSINFLTLNTSLATNFAQIRDIFSVSFNSSSSTFGLFKTPSNLQANEFSLSVDTSLPNQAVSVTYTQNGVTNTIYPTYTFLSNNQNGANDILITIDNGTPLDGLELIFFNDGTGIGTTYISITQGICDILSHFLNNNINGMNGSLKTMEASIVKDNYNYRSKIEKEETSLNEERNNLIDKYAKLQGTIASYNKQLETMKAFDLERQSQK